MVSSHLGTPLGVGTSHEHFGPQDSPRPGLGGSHHLPPYSIFCNASLRLQPKGSFSRDSQVGVSKLSRNCPGWSPGTLNAHNSRLPMDQGTLQRNNFGREDERRVRPGLLSHTIGETGLPPSSLPIHPSYECTRSHASGSQERSCWPLPAKGGPHQGLDFRRRHGLIPTRHPLEPG
jgi:hypothetical protein